MATADDFFTALKDFFTKWGVSFTDATPVTPPPTTTPPLVILRPGDTGSLIDSKGVVWSITADGWVLRNSISLKGSSGTGSIEMLDGRVIAFDATTQTGYVWDTGSNSWTAVIPGTLPITPAPTPPVSTIPSSPSVVAKTALMNYLHAIKGNKCISGQFVERGQTGQLGMNAIGLVKQITGKTPGLLGFDCWGYGNPMSTPAYGGWTDNAIAHHRSGGIVGLSLMMPNPQSGGGIDDLTHVDETALITSGTASNTNLIAMLRSVGNPIRVLDNAGVPVLFRPYHENDGNWFWYGKQSISDAGMKKLWAFTRNYMENALGLHNIIWINGHNAGSANPSRIDIPNTHIAGIDVYSDNPSGVAGDVAKLRSTGLLLAITEFGPGSPPVGNPSFDMTVFTNMLKTPAFNDVVYWLNWWDGNSPGKAGWGIDMTTNSKIALADPRVLNQGDIKYQ